MPYAHSIVLVLVHKETNNSGFKKTLTGNYDKHYVFSFFLIVWNKLYNCNQTIILFRKKWLRKYIKLPQCYKKTLKIIEKIALKQMCCPGKRFRRTMITKKKVLVVRESNIICHTIYVHHFSDLLLFFLSYIMIYQFMTVSLM